MLALPKVAVSDQNYTMQILVCSVADLVSFPESVRSNSIRQEVNTEYSECKSVKS